jgi:hypothetical protein
MSRPRVSLLLLATIAALLAACTLERRPEDIPTPPARIVIQPASPSEADQLLSEAARWRSLDTREFNIERENARNRFVRGKSDFNRVRLALVLAFAPAAASPASTSNDDNELTALLEPLLTGPNAANTPGGWEIRALATLIFGMTSERRKIRDLLRDSQARLTLARKDDTRDAEARVLRARIEELEAKLDALKSIDRSVNRRVETPTK